LNSVLRDSQTFANFCFAKGRFSLRYGQKADFRDVTGHSVLST